MNARDLALSLAAEGLPVFPCRENKAPTCPAGFKEATSDPAGVRDLWARYHGPLIGVPTGIVAGFDALDLDPKHGAAAWWRANRQKIPDTRAHRTRSGGLHVLFRHASGVQNTQSKIAAGVDTRGEGGYVIWWPAHGSRVVEAPLAGWPEWLLLRLQRRPKPVVRMDGPTTPMVDADAAQRIANRVLTRLASAADGQKHFALRKAAFTLGGLLDQLPFGHDEAQQRLLRAVQQAGAADLNNAAKTVAWALECGLKSPFRLEARR